MFTNFDTEQDLLLLKLSKEDGKKLRPGQGLKRFDGYWSLDLVGLCDLTKHMDTLFRVKKQYQVSVFIIDIRMLRSRGKRRQYNKHR